MTAVRTPTDFPLVDNVERGAEIRRRREALGIRSVREFERLSGARRGKISAAEHGRASAATYRELELWLTLQEAGGSAPVVGPVSMRPIGDPSAKLLEVEVEGPGGFRMIVRAPVDNPEALAAAVRELLPDRMSNAPDDNAPEG